MAVHLRITILDAVSRHLLHKKCLYLYQHQNWQNQHYY